MCFAYSLKQHIIFRQYLLKNAAIAYTMFNKIEKQLAYIYVIKYSQILKNLAFN